MDKEAVKVINECTGARLQIREEEGVVDMCQAIKDLMEDAAAEARAEASSAKAEASSARAEASKATEEKISVLLKSVKAVMKKTGMTLEHTFSVLDISRNDRDKLMPLL
jgi:hypothetical protein